MVKDGMINIKEIRLFEETKKEIVFNWMNKKNTIPGTIFLKNRKLIFQINSRGFPFVFYNYCLANCREEVE